MSRNLAHIGNEELKSFLNSFDNVLCDCDGVLFVLFKPIEGAAQAIQKLKNLGKDVKYATNNTSVTLEKFTKRLCSYGLPATVDDVALPTTAIINYLKSINFSKKVYVIGLNGVKNEFINAGFELADYEPSVDIPEQVESLVAALKDNLSVGAVIVDYDINLNYVRLQKAMIYAKRPDVLLISGGSDLEVPVGNGLTIMGPGHFQRALEYMVKREFMKFGKPGKYFNEYVAQRFNLNGQRSLMIGDSFADMILANAGGYKKLMVLTGNTSEQDLNNCKDVDLLPDYYIYSLADLATLIDMMS